MRATPLPMASFTYLGFVISALTPLAARMSALARWSAASAGARFGEVLMLRGDDALVAR